MDRCCVKILNKIAPQGGFTLIEMMITVAVIAVVLGFAVPSFNDFFAKNRLKRAAEDVYGLITKAKAETVTRNMNLVVTVDNSWCVGYASVACDCTSSDCVVPVAGTDVQQVVAGSAFDGVNMTSAGFNRTFNSVRGTTAAATISLQSGGWELDVVLSPQGRIRICAPATSTGTMGYEPCP